MPVLMMPQAPAAQLDALKFSQLLKSNRRFKQCWDRDGGTFSDVDILQSDNVLAEITLSEGWSWEEIKSLLIANRRESDPPLRDSDFARLQVLLQARMDVFSSDLVAETNLELERLNLGLGLKIVHIARILSEPPYYRLQIADGNTMKLRGNELNNSTKFRDIATLEAKTFIPRFSPTKWDKFTEKIVKLAVDEEVDPYETPHGRVLYYLRCYLDDGNYPMEDPNEAYAADYKPPFYKNGFCYIFLGRFKEWVKIHNPTQHNQWNQDHDLSASLKAASCEMEKMDFRPSPGEHTSSTVWRLPAEFSREWLG